MTFTLKIKDIKRLRKYRCQALSRLLYNTLLYSGYSDTKLYLATYQRLKAIGHCTKSGKRVIFEYSK